MCTYEKVCLFGSPGQLNAFGQAADECLKRIPVHDQCITVENDHILRNEASLERIWKSIDENPYHWNEDTFFVNL